MTGDFEEFAMARTPSLYRSAFLLSGDRHAAEDLVQETLAKVYVRWHRRLGGRIDNPAAYAQTTLVRTFVSSKRRRSSTELPSGELPDVPAADPASYADLRVTLQAVLADLPPLDRAVVVLRYLDDLDVDTVADRLSLSPGAVRNRSMRALARLRPLLDPTSRSTP